MKEFEAWTNEGNPLPVLRVHRQSVVLNDDGSLTPRQQVKLPREAVIFAMHTRPGSTTLHVYFADTEWIVLPDERFTPQASLILPKPVRVPAYFAIDDGGPGEFGLGRITIFYTNCDPSE